MLTGLGPAGLGHDILGLLLGTKHNSMGLVTVGISQILEHRQVLSFKQ